jgi:putative SOS response-associated peptidase YedK
MALAGVFERKKSVAADEEKVDLTNEEAVIVTMSSAHGDLEWLHDRQPMVLSTDEDFDAWMFGDWRGVASTRTAKDLAGVFAWHPVTTRMNVADYSGEDAPKKVKRAVEKDAGSIASMFAAAKKRKTET